MSDELYVKASDLLKSIGLYQAKLNRIQDTSTDKHPPTYEVDGYGNFWETRTRRMTKAEWLDLHKGVDNAE